MANAPLVAWFVHSHRIVEKCWTYALVKFAIACFEVLNSRTRPLLVYRRARNTFPVSTPIKQHGLSVLITVVVWLGAIYPLGSLIQNLTRVKGETWPIYTFIVIVLFNSIVLLTIWYFRVRGLGPNVGNRGQTSKIRAFRANVRAAMDDWTWDTYQVCVSLAMSLSYICYTYSGESAPGHLAKSSKVLESPVFLCRQ
jgi:hypothetical protein